MTYCLDNYSSVNLRDVCRDICDKLDKAIAAFEAGKEYDLKELTDSILSVCKDAGKIVKEERATFLPEIGAVLDRLNICEETLRSLREELAKSPPPKWGSGK